MGKILRILFGIGVVLTLFTGCKEEKFGIVNLTTWENINIFIDGKFKAIAGEGITKIKLQEGSHIIKVEGNSVDGEWLYKIEKEVFISSDVEINITLNPLQYPSENRLRRLEAEKLKQLEEANRYGCKTIEEFKDYKLFNKKIEELEKDIEEIKSLRKEFMNKKNGYLIKNDYFDLVSLSLKEKDTILSYHLKKKVEYEKLIFKDASYEFYITDEELNLITSIFAYPRYSFKSFEKVSGYHYNRIKNSKAKKKYVFMTIGELNYTYDTSSRQTSVRIDYSKSFNGKMYKNIERASTKNLDNKVLELEEYRQKLSNICK
ncbi:hypothetical protein [Aliarcobacter skirrowii]|uniref:hypothetical protein n=1 Tax=Aliarcobacter skirrowii TaxID=28200 RepID=UPI002A367FC4|nr:hypothetical protein [Aliarcobacter skirrowii]MDY0180211.1 hypothetical protein [Aliarcobacter skirrowii]